MLLAGKAHIDPEGTSGAAAASKAPASAPVSKKATPSFTSAPRSAPAVADIGGAAITTSVDEEPIAKQPTSSEDAAPALPSTGTTTHVDDLGESDEDEDLENVFG